VRVTLLGYLKGKQKDRHPQGPEEIVTAFRELWDNITFEELQLVFALWRDRLPRILEHEGECFGKCRVCKSVISYTNKSRDTISSLFGHPVCENI